MGNSEVRIIIDFVFVEYLEMYLLENFIVVKKVIEKGLMVVRVRMVVKKVCEFIRCKSVFEILNLLGKLVDCLLKDFFISEFYVVEGDFVGGLVK